VILKDGIGLWLSGEALITHIIDAFKNLFMATSAHLRTKASLGQPVSSNSPFLDHYQLLLSIPPSVEISRTVR